MGFFGMSSTGKNAMNQLGNIAGAQQGQAQQDWLRGGMQYDRGNDVMPWYLKQQMDRADTGMGTPEDALGYGNRLNPWVQPTIGTLNGNQAGVVDKYNSMPGVGSTMDKVNGNLDDYGHSITGTADTISGDINDTSGRMSGRENQANGAITGDYNDRYNGLTGKTGETYGNLTGKSDATYGDLSKLNTTVYGGLQGSANQNFDQQQKNAEMLRPGGEFQTAQTARSFAPVMASTQATLRRMGVGAGDPQSMAALNSVGAARARAMDDAAASGTAKYVNASNDILSNRFGTQAGLQTGWLGNESGFQQGKLGNEIGLGRAGLQATTDLSREQGAGLRSAAQNYADTQSGIDAGRLAANTANSNTAQNRAADYYGQRGNAALTERGLNRQDLADYTGVADRGDRTALTAAGLQRDAANSGVNWNAQNIGEQDRAAGNVGNYGFGMMGQGQGLMGQGNGLSGQAANGYGQIYGNEAANAGWGLKMIGGLAGAGLQAATGLPIGGAMSGGGGGGGGFTPYSSARPFNPSGGYGIPQAPNIGPQYGSGPGIFPNYNTNLPAYGGGY